MSWPTTEKWRERVGIEPTEIELRKRILGESLGEYGFSSTARKCYEFEEQNSEFCGKRFCFEQIFRIIKSTTPYRETEGPPVDMIYGAFFYMRVKAYIDGFNVYGGICELVERQSAGPKPHHLKWLNYVTLCDWIAANPARIEPINGFGGILDPMALSGVDWYTALNTNDKQVARVDRHRAFIAACTAVGINVHVGHFKANHRQCFNCQRQVFHWEEKETDVHISVDLVADALSGSFDVALLFSTDSDIAPAVKIASERSPVKIISVAISPRAHSKEILAHAHGKLTLRRGHLEKNLLPDQLTVPGGVVYRPSRYRP